MLLPVSWAAAFLFSVLNMHYPAPASTPEPQCCVSGVYPAGWLAAGGLQCRFSAALRNPGNKKRADAPLGCICSSSSECELYGNYHYACYLSYNYKCMPFAQPGKRKLCSKRNVDGCAAMFSRRISVCRYSAGVPIFLSVAKKTLSIVYEPLVLSILRPCTFFQRVSAEIRTFSSEFLVEPYVFLWMSLLREIFRTTFLKNRMSLTQPRQGQTVFRTKIARPTLCAHLVYGLQQADAAPIKANSGSNAAPGAF